ncbi:hypothetical protein Trydic_g9627 [Trypoxylus dichotomus]
MSKSVASAAHESSLRLRAWCVITHLLSILPAPTSDSPRFRSRDAETETKALVDTEPSTSFMMYYYSDSKKTLIQ